MAEAPTVLHLDLRTALPPGLTVSGLSSPRFDGMNFFRTPTAARSSVGFETQTDQFVQFEYQLYSPTADVTGVLKLDGQLLDQTTFPAGEFTPHVRAGSFVSAGLHHFTLDYRCQNQFCAAPLSQYWTQLSQLPSREVMARQKAGLGVERWWLNAPGSPLRITGAGPIYFDGLNFARQLPGRSFELSWPSGNVLNASLMIQAVQPFRVSLVAGGKVLDFQDGDQHRAVSPTFSLAGQEAAQSLTVKVECLGDLSDIKLESETGCARLYFPQVTVLTAPPASAIQVGGAVVTALLLLIGLWGWLRLPAGRRVSAG